jgi:hypothetical protein
MNWSEEMGIVISKLADHYGKERWGEDLQEATFRFLLSIRKNPMLEHELFASHRDDYSNFAKKVEERLWEFLPKIRGEKIQKVWKEIQPSALRVGNASEGNDSNKDLTDEEKLDAISWRRLPQKFTTPDETANHIQPAFSQEAINEFFGTLLKIQPRDNGNPPIVNLAITIWVFEMVWGHNEISHLRRKQNEQNSDAQADFRSSIRKIALETCLLFGLGPNPRQLLDNVERALLRRFKKAQERSAAHILPGMEIRNDGKANIWKMWAEFLINLSDQSNSGMFLRELNLCGEVSEAFIGKERMLTQAEQTIRLAIEEARDGQSEAYYKLFSDYLWGEAVWHQRKKKRFFLGKIFNFFAAFEKVRPLLLGRPDQTPEQVRQKARDILRQLEISSHPWPSQGLLVDLATHTGQIAAVTEAVLEALVQIEDRNPYSEIPEKWQLPTDVRPPLWDTIHLLAETLEELWCYCDWKPVAAAIAPVMERGSADVHQLFATMLALKEIAERAQSAEKDQDEQLKAISDLLGLGILRMGMTRQAVLLFILPLILESKDSLRKILRDLVSTTDRDPDPVVSVLRAIARHRFDDASPFEALSMVFSDEETRRVLYAVWQDSRDLSLENLAQELVPLLYCEKLEQRLAVIFTLAHLSERFKAEAGFSHYWELVAEKLLHCLTDKNPFVTWSVVIALVPVVDSFEPNKWTMELVRYLREHRQTASMCICEILEEALEDKFRCKVMAYMGILSPFTFSTLQFATGVLLSEVGHSKKRLAAVLELLDKLETTGELIAIVVAGWVRHRLNRIK